MSSTRAKNKEKWEKARAGDPKKKSLPQLSQYVAENFSDITLLQAMKRTDADLIRLLESRGVPWPPPLPAPRLHPRKVSSSSSSLLSSMLLPATLKKSSPPLPSSPSNGANAFDVSISLSTLRPQKVLPKVVDTDKRLEENQRDRKKSRSCESHPIVTIVAESKDTELKEIEKEWRTEAIAITHTFDSLLPKESFVSDSAVGRVAIQQTEEKGHDKRITQSENIAIYLSARKRYERLTKILIAQEYKWQRQHDQRMHTLTEIVSTLQGAASAAVLAVSATSTDTVSSRAAVATTNGIDVK